MKATSVVLCAALLFTVGASQAARAQTTATAQGVDAVEVMKATATVEKLDLEHRKITLLLENSGAVFAGFV